jgi:hypothetical protein
MSYNSMVKSLYSNKEFSNDLPKEHLRSTGGKYWKDCYNKRGYMTLQKSVLTDDVTSDHCIGNDREFQVAIIQQVPPLVFTLAESLWVKEYFESEHFDFKQGLLDIINLPKSRATVNALYENTAKYIVQSKKREPNDVEPETIVLFKKHIAMYELGLKRLMEMSDENQELIILSGIVPGSNLGYDQFTHGSKRTFSKMLFAYCERHLGMSSGRKDFLTADMVLTIITTCVAKGHNPPFVLFYRTHTYPKVRSVFGSGVIGKAVAALMAACKRLADDKLYLTLKEDDDAAKQLYARASLEKDKQTNLKEYLPRVGDWPWVAWQEWDTQFETIRATLDGISDDIEVIGTDFTGYDQCMIAADFEWKLDIETPFHDVFVFTHMQQKSAEVWTNGYRITHSVKDKSDGSVTDEVDQEGIEFKSGIHSTSEDGSSNHYDLNVKVAKDMGAKIEHSILLSDDDLTAFRGFSNIDDHAELMKSYGFEISADKTSMFSRDGYVEFLKNHIGYIFSTDHVDVLANMKSRIYGLAHTERSLEKRGIYHITGDVPIDQATSKFASIGSTGAPFISEILKVVQDTTIGKGTIAAIVVIKANPDMDIGLYRPDLSTSFRPERAFQNVDVPAVLRS